jgi:tyrosine-specific transport protein
MAALNYAGIFASILLILYPVLMAWRRRYVEQALGGYRVAGGRAGLATAFLFGIAVILLDIAYQLHLLPVPKP